MRLLLLCLPVAIMLGQPARAAPAVDWFTVPAPRHAAVPPPRPVPSRPPPVSGMDRSAILTAFVPFYRIGSNGMSVSEQQIIETEASMRPVYSVTVPFEHAEVPLPPGNWTVVSMDPEHLLDDGPASIGTVLARIEDHAVTGIVIVRGSDKRTPGSLTSLPPDEMCDGPGRYASGRVSPASDEHDFCWFVSEATDPGLLWTIPNMPPALRIAVGTLRRTHDSLPPRLVGATIVRIDGNRWIEITSFLDPRRSGVADSRGMRQPVLAAMADPAMRAFVDRMAAWTRQRIPLIAHLSSARRSADEVAAINFDAPQ